MGNSVNRWTIVATLGGVTTIIPPSLMEKLRPMLRPRSVRFQIPIFAFTLSPPSFASFGG